MKKINSIQDLNKYLGKKDDSNLFEKKEKHNRALDNVEKSYKELSDNIDKEYSNVFDNMEDNDIKVESDGSKKGIKSGFTVTDEIIEEDKLKSKVMKYISYKKRTESEIRQKFADTNQDILDNIIENFKAQNYINENDYIEKSIKEFLALKSLSIKELTYKLIQKGVNKNILDNYVYENREMLVQYEISSAKKIIRKKMVNTEIENIKKYLFQKGYMSESVNIAIDELNNN